MITCVEQRISEYVDGDLPPAVARELEAHFVMCADCRALLLEYYALVSATHLLRVRMKGTADHEHSVTEIPHGNSFGQARTSDLLA